MTEDNKIQTWISICLYSFIFIFGTFSNMIVIIFFAFKIKRHTTFRWFVVNLAIADGIVCIVTPLHRFYLMATDGYWHLGSFLCKLFTPIGFINVNVSAWILCAIAFERYKAIGTPLKRRYTRKHVNLICFIMWLVSILMSLPIFLLTDVQAGSCIPTWNREQHLSVAIIGLLFQSVFPILIMALSYFMIRKAFTRQIHNTKSTISKLTTINGNIIKNKRNTIRIKSQMTTQTLLLAFVIFVICSLPYNIFYVVAVYMFRYGIYTAEEIKRHSNVYGEIEFWLSNLVVLNSIMNCVVYAGKFPTFRRFIFVKVFFFCKARGRTGETHTNLLEETTIQRSRLGETNNNNGHRSNHLKSQQQTTSLITKTSTCPFNESPRKPGLNDEDMEMIPMDQMLLVDRNE